MTRSTAEHGGKAALFTTIVVGADGSNEGDAAVAVATSMAAGSGARVVVVHVVEILSGKGGQYPLHVDEDEIRTRIAATVEQARADGVDIDLEVHPIAFGGPAHVIAQTADRVAADLIVIGNRGHNPVAEILLGNVPARLLHIAHRPVLVVPAKAASGT